MAYLKYIVLSITVLLSRALSEVKLPSSSQYSLNSSHRLTYRLNNYDNHNKSPPEKLWPHPFIPQYHFQTPSSIQVQFPKFLRGKVNDTFYKHYWILGIELENEI